MSHKKSMKWQAVAKTAVVQEDTDCVISRDAFLVVLAQTGKPRIPGAYALRTESIEALNNLREEPSPAAVGAPPGLPPPPGLEDCLGDDAGANELPQLQEPPQQEPATLTTEVIAREPERFKVLLTNLPPTILKECMLRVILEQANLTNVVDMALRPNGKALITFGAYECVPRCIKHFRDRQWDSSQGPVGALYVRTVKDGSSTKKDTPALAAKNFSVKATPFVPTMPKSSHKFSVDAPVFVPTMNLMTMHNDSNASTSEPASDTAMSDSCESERPDATASCCT